MRIVILNNDIEAADYGQNHRQSDDVIAAALAQGLPFIHILIHVLWAA